MASHWSAVCCLQDWVAHFQCFDARLEPLHKVIVDGLLNKDAFGSNTRLPSVDESRQHRSVSSPIQVGVSTHNAWIRASKLKNSWLDLRSSNGRNSSAAARRTSERHGANTPIADHGFHSWSFQEQHLKHALWEASFVKDLSHSSGAPGNVGIVLDEYNVTSHQSGCGNSCKQPKRCIPGQNAKNWSEGRVLNPAPLSIGFKRLWSKKLLCIVGVILIAPSALRDLPFRFPHWFPHLVSQELPKVVRVLSHQRSNLPEQGCAVGVREFAPRLVSCHSLG
mmetsp:Transcript_2350/g.5560  ORF Transcript_2350/g.5560 Transcript_2350/m.5560 type:complete len:279 (-) Transcript_2350:86-922(-)